MPHLTLVPALPALPPLPTCHCGLTEGRYWFQGAWHCITNGDVVRIGSYAGRGWHHYPGQRRNWQNLPTQTELRSAA